MDRTFADCLRVGHGYDVHALAPGLRLRLCGVDLEHDRGMRGPFGRRRGRACAVRCPARCRRSGRYRAPFPDTAAEYAGIDSMVLLERCMELLAGEGFGVVNADVTIAMQRPPAASPTSMPCAGGWPACWAWMFLVCRSRRPRPNGSASSAARRGWRPMPWC